MFLGSVAIASSFKICRQTLCRACPRRRPSLIHHCPDRENGSSGDPTVWPGSPPPRSLVPNPRPVHLPTMDTRTNARAQLIGAAVLFSTGGAAIKAAAFTGWQIASFRSGIAALALLLMAPAARRGWTPRAALVGVAYAGCLTLFVLANRLTTAA